MYIIPQLKDLAERIRRITGKRPETSCESTQEEGEAAENKRPREENADLTTEYSPEKGWLTRQFENVKRDVAEWPEWMRRESGRMKTDLTTAEMRARLEELRGAGLAEVRTRGPYLCLTPQEAEWILDLALEALARREERTSFERLVGPICKHCGIPEKQCDCLPREDDPGTCN